MVLRPASLVSPGSLTEIQNISPRSELLNQIWFNKIPSRYSALQGHCSKSLLPAMLLLSQHVSPLLIYSCSFYFSLFFSSSMQLRQKQKEKMTYFSMYLHGNTSQIPMAVMKLNFVRTLHNFSSWVEKSLFQILRDEASLSVLLHPF